MVVMKNDIEVKPKFYNFFNLHRLHVYKRILLEIEYQNKMHTLKLMITIQMFVIEKTLIPYKNM